MITSFVRLLWTIWDLGTHTSWQEPSAEASFGTMWSKCKVYCLMETNISRAHLNGRRCCCTFKVKSVDGIQISTRAKTAEAIAWYDPLKVSISHGSREELQDNSGFIATRSLSYTMSSALSVGPVDRIINLLQNLILKLFMSSYYLKIWITSLDTTEAEKVYLGKIPDAWSAPLQDSKSLWCAQFRHKSEVVGVLLAQEFHMVYMAVFPQLWQYTLPCGHFYALYIIRFEHAVQIIITISIHFKSHLV